MLRQGGGGSVVGEQGGGGLGEKCLQCPLRGVKVVKCWFGENVKVLASHFLRSRNMLPST